MKKMFILFAILLVSLPSYSINIAVYGKGGVELFHYNFEAELPANVGEVSVIAFDSQKVPYLGDTRGINQLFGIAGKGDEDIEVISDFELKAHGWCFAINGKVPHLMSDETYIPSQNTSINWFYAHAHYKNGRWIAQCVPN